MPLGGGLTVASSVAGIASGIGQYIGGEREVSKAREGLSKLKTPFYKIQDEYFQNKNIAANQAQGGLPGATKDYVTNERNRGFGAAISGLNQTGGDPNAYADLFDSFNNSINKTAAQDAATQMENIKYFTEANKDLAGQKTTQWSLNEYQQYQNKLKELTERMAAGKQNKAGGIQTAIGSLGATGTSLQNNDLMSKLFGDKDPAQTMPTPANFRQLQEQATGGQIQLPTSSPSTQNFRPYQSSWLNG
jgi:hypothetical protein